MDENTSNAGSGSIVLFADFDSGNMAKYERVFAKTPPVAAPAVSNPATTATSAQPNQTQASSSLDSSNVTSSPNNNTNQGGNVNPQIKFDIEFNVWTKPDCFGTPVGPNSNRTWFYFGVKGGHGKHVKFNIMNMNKQGRLFEMGMLPVFRTLPGHEKWSRIYTKPSWQCTEQNNFIMSFIHRIPDKKESISYFAFCFPYSYEESQTALEKLDREYEHCKQLNHQTSADPDGIYYHREIMCYSLDKRRIDLITVSNFNGMTLKREPRFDPAHLFPVVRNERSYASPPPNENKRCYRFDKKRVFILTSRVHPGETPASYVFNGFLEFIMRKDDPRARALRKNFVFKLVPMLNPDGVVRGHYRTDQLGVNLNRVYLDPSFSRHPSIYAIKSLIVFHHINNRTSKEHDGLKFDNIFKLEYDKEDELIDIGADLSSSEVKSNEILTDEPTTIKKTVCTTSSNSGGKLLSIVSPIVSVSSSNSSSSLSSDAQTQQQSKRAATVETKSLQQPSATRPKSSMDEVIQNAIEKNYRNAASFNILTRSLESQKETLKPKENNIELFQESKSGSNSFRIGNENSDDEDNNDQMTNGSQKNSPHLNDPTLLLINPLWSGCAFYMDLHGHAGRKGCFIYGNSIDNELYQIENVLFTRLIAFNSQHFDFDGCNFSVRNMYMRDKREGLSKEGSGRVAMYKTLGLIHSYTLECCYAAGRVMNQIAPAQNTAYLNYASANFNGNKQFSGMISPPLHADLPPKFMPEHYMDVGKAVAIAALDIIEMNQHSRVPNTSFGSLEAVRNWIKFYIKSKTGGGVTATSSNNANSSSFVNASSNQSNGSNQAASNAKKPVNNNQKYPSQIRKNSINNQTIKQTDSKAPIGLTKEPNKQAPMANSRLRQRKNSLDETAGSLNKPTSGNGIKTIPGPIKTDTARIIKDRGDLIRSETAMSQQAQSLAVSTPPPPSLLNTRKSSQYNGARVAPPARKLMPITKASVLTDSTVFNQASGTTSGTTSKPVAKSVNLKLNTLTNTKKTANPTRLNMLNILINSGNQSGSAGSTRGVGIRNSVNKPASSRLSIIGNIDKNEEDRDIDNTEDRTEFEAYSESKATGATELDNKASRGIEDNPLLLQPTASATTPSSANLNKRVFFSVSFQRTPPTAVRNVRRTKSVFFT